MRCRNRRRRKRLQPAAYFSLPERSSTRYFPESYRSPTPLSPEPAPAQKRPSASSNCQRCCTPFLDCRPRFLFSHFPFSFFFLFCGNCSKFISSKKFFHHITLTPSLTVSPIPSDTPASRLGLSRGSQHTHTHAQDHVFQKRHPHVHWQQWRRGSETRRRRVYCEWLVPFCCCCCCCCAKHDDFQGGFASCVLYCVW